MLGLGLALEIFGLLDVTQLLGTARQYADAWWMIALLIVLQILLFTFALAGSLFLWVVAPLYPPPVAALILAAGGTLGGLSAYWFARSLSREWLEKIEQSQVFKVLQRQGNFFSLFSLRVTPAFPHVLVNYSSGILRLKLRDFLLAAGIGIYIKSYLYADIIYAASTASSLQSLLNMRTLAPLLLLAGLSLLALWLRYRWIRAQK